MFDTCLLTGIERSTPDNLRYRTQGKRENDRYFWHSSTWTSHLLLSRELMLPTHGAEHFLLRPFCSEEPVPGWAGGHGFQTGVNCLFTKVHEESQLCVSGEPDWQRLCILCCVDYVQTRSWISLPSEAFCVSPCKSPAQWGGIGSTASWWVRLCLFLRMQQIAFVHVNVLNIISVSSPVLPRW